MSHRHLPKNIALLCDEADRLLQLNINLLRQMVEDPHARHTWLTVRFMSYGKTEPFLLMKPGSMILSEVPSVA
ncbi:hypothetical protein DM616_25090 [Escherichia coli]|nr:hypothetical protein [Escherichia coli]